jgi:thiamine-phosphate pyrophosphorylase
VNVDFARARLYTFVDTAYLHGRDAAAVAEQLCAGGSDIVQLRAKRETPEQVRALAHHVAEVTRRHSVPLVINDFPEIAREVGADVVHLGQEDFFDAGFTHREQHAGLHSPLLLGLSSHAPEQAQRAVQAGADYVAVGPIFATGTKPGRPAVTLDYVKWAAKNLAVPWFAIGGITLANLSDVLAAGAKRVCVVSAILNATDVAAACRAFKARLG